MTKTQKIIKHFEKSKQNFIQEIVGEAKAGDVSAIKMLTIEYQTQIKIDNIIENATKITNIINFN